MIRALPSLMLLILGLIVFTLPYWLPLAVEDIRVEPEAFERSGQVGGALIGVGLALLIVTLVKRRQR